MKIAGRYEFIIEKDHTVIIVHRWRAEAIKLLLNHDDAEIIQRQNYEIAIVDADEYRPRINIRWDGKNRMSLARWVLGLTDPKKIVTFKNNSTLDFRDGNLIISVKGRQSQNRIGAQKNSTSKVRGVSWYKKYGKWNGQVVHNGKNYNVGYDKDKAVIERAVIAKRKELLELSFMDQD